MGVQRTREEQERIIWFNLLSAAYMDRGLTLKSIKRVDNNGPVMQPTDGHKPVQMQSAV